MSWRFVKWILIGNSPKPEDFHITLEQYEEYQRECLKEALSDRR